MVPIQKIIIFVTILSLWNGVVQAQGYTSVAPMWLTSNYMRAGSQDVIAKATDSSDDPIFTFTFSSPLPGTPNLAYGIRRYRGKDTIREQIFQIRKLGLNSTSFRVQIDITGSTTILTLNVPYLAIDPNFPHHLNSFDNVPINYGRTLSNITQKESYTTFFTNTINYTNQASGRPYNKFETPLDGNKILLYITSISIKATGGIVKYYPTNINVTYKIMTSQTYSLSVSVFTEVAIAKLQFSMIVFNANDVESSKKYVIVYDTWETKADGGFIEIPSAFIDNFIMGLIEFSTIDGACIINYQWSYITKNGVHGVQLAKSVSTGTDFDCALTRMKSTIFYMKTWQCPAHNPYFNLTTNLCQNECGAYFFANTSVLQCQECQWSCSKCVNSTFCSGCDSVSDFRVLSNVSGKATCLCMRGYYQDPMDLLNKRCLACVPNCLTCNSSTICQVCNEVGGYIMTADKKCKKCGYGCIACDETPYFCYQCQKGLIFDKQQQKCVCSSGTYPSNQTVSCNSCSLQCEECSGPSSNECTKCSITSPLPFFNPKFGKCGSTCGDYFFQNKLILHCQSCPVGCSQCSGAENCTGCNYETDKRNLSVSAQGILSCFCIQGYYQDTENTKNSVCLKCNITGCLACNSSKTCTLCNNLTGNVLDSTGQCKYCGYGCLSCNQTNCQKCAIGMEYDSLQKKCVCFSGTYASNTSVTCLACHPLCGSCTGPSSNECTSCSSSSQAPFLNQTTHECQSKCGQYFYENWLIYDCSRCPVGCNRCRGPNNCTQCNLDTNKRSLITIGGESRCSCIEGYYQDSNNTKNDVCLKCNISNCIACNSSTVCTKCINKLPGYGLTQTGKCITECGYGCDVCIELSSKCERCVSGFTMDASSQCICPSGTIPSTFDVQCIACHSKCKTCNGPTQFNCTSCAKVISGSPYFNQTSSTCQSSCGLYFFENITVFECQKCFPNCRDCAKSPDCSQCDLKNHFRRLISRNGQRNCTCIAGYYQDPKNPSNPVCQKCIENCLTCTDNSTCNACNQAKGFILGQNKTCIPCGFGCVSCDQASAQCLKCRPEFELSQQTKQCKCPNGTVRATNSMTCTSCHPICQTCSGPSQYECLSCWAEQNRISLRQSNNLVQCICDPFAFTQPSDGSLNCVKKTNQSCSYGFIFMRQKNSCIEICGDGKNFGMYQCDDGNRIDGDGCSKTCQVEEDFDCKKIDGTDTCYYIGIVNIIQAKAYKYPFSNNLLIQCKLDPIKKFFYTINWKQGIVLIGPKMEVLDAWMEGQWLNINTTYFEDLTGKTMTIKYSSGLARNKNQSQLKRNLFESVFDFDITLRDYQLPISPSNNIKPTYLQEETYETVREVQRSLFITATCTIVMILTSFVLKTVFPFWQLIFSLQTIFLSLGVINYINPLLTGLTEFSVVKGLRSTKIYFENLVSPNKVIQNNIASLGYVSSFFGNMNIMIFIWFGLILTSCALFLMSKKDLTMGFPFQFCKRTLMLLVLFSSMGYSFSVGLITSAYPFELIVAGICGAITLGQIYNLLKHMKRYYHFDKTFDLTNRKVKYIVGMIILTRIGQSLAISLFRDNTFVAACIILTAQVLLTTGFIMFRPYSNSLYNLLNIISELAVTGFLSIDLILNIDFIESIQTENFLSLVQISINFLVVLLMVGCFMYAIVTDFFVKEKGMNPLRFDEFAEEKSESIREYKKPLEMSREKFNLKIEDFQEDDNSSAIIDNRNSKFLIVSN